MLYCLGIVGYVALRYTIRDGRWWLVALNDFAPFLFLPLVPLLLCALIAHDRLMVMVLAAPLALFGLLYGALFLPKPGLGAAAGESSLRVMTANLHIDNETPDWVAATVAAEGPELLTVQELSPAMARALARSLDESFPYRALYPDPGGDGSGLFSRYPIVRERTFTLGASTIVCQDVTLDVRGRSVRVLNVRLRHPQYGLQVSPDFPQIRPVARGVDWQADEVDDLLDRLDRLDLPTLALGDFNMTDQSPQYRRLARRLGDSQREAGWGFGFTFPDFVTRRGALFNTPAVIRIDYIWHDGGLSPVTARVGPPLGSDHRPMVAEFRLSKP